MSSTYQLYRLNLSQNQKANLAKAYQNKSEYTLRLSNKQLQGEDKVPLTNSQNKKIQKAELQKKGVEIKISRTQAMKGGSIFSSLAGLATKALPFATKAASHILPGLATGQLDIINVFMAYKLKSYYNSYWLCNGLFGYDGTGFDKFVAFHQNSGNLVVSSTTGDYITVGTTIPYPAGPNAGELNIRIVLSIHWDVHNTLLTNQSSVWCDGVKLIDFTSRSSPESTQMTFGDLNPNGITPLDGDISLFWLYKGLILDPDMIKPHHSVLINRYK